MATAPTNKPNVTVLPDPPKRDGSLTPSEFSTQTGVWLGAQQTYSDEVDALSTWQQDTAQEVYDNAVEAEASAQIAAATGNYQGEWSTLTGAYSKGISVSDGGVRYLLKVDLSDITSSQPSLNSSDWDALNLHNVLGGRDATSAHPASAIQLSNGNDSQSVLQTLSNSTVSRITNAGVGFANWPQGKGVVLGDRVHFGYNMGEGHGGNTLHAYSTSTLDGTQWSEPELIAAPRDFGGGALEATAWGMVELGGELYAAVRFREGGDEGEIYQSIYKSDTSGKNWTLAADLTFETAELLTPVLLHDGVVTTDGRIAFGYHDSNGSLGVLIIDPSDSYSTEEFVLLTAANNNIAGSVLQAELSFLKRSDNNNILIVSRTQNVATEKPLSWVVDGNFTAIISGAVESPVGVNVNPVSMTFNTDFTKVLFFYSNRYNNYVNGVDRAALYMGELSLSDAYSLNWTNFKQNKLINLSGTTTSAAASAGVQKAVKKGDQIYIAVASKSRDNDDGSDVYCVVLDFEDDSFLGLNLDSLQASQVNAESEIRLNKNANYNPRIRMGGKSLLTRDDENNKIELGTYNDAGMALGVYTHNASGTTPTVYFNPEDDNWLGRLGVIDINRDINHTKSGVQLHAGVGWRMRIGGDSGSLGGSFVYHDDANDVVELGTTAGNYDLHIWATPTNKVTFKSQNTTDLMTITFAADTVESDLTYRANIVMLDAMFAPLTANKGDLFSTTLKEGAQAFCLDGRKSGEGVGSGTGVPVYYNSGVWRTYYDNSEVQV